MYLQLTTRCNMRCRHCCFSCTSKGEDMSEFVFMKAILGLDPEYVTLGGGEPTVHPLFWKLFERAVDNVMFVTIITNGKRKRDALRLLSYADEFPNRTCQSVDVNLSQDEFHSKIDPEVVQAYRRLGKDHLRSCDRPIRTGRWKHGSRVECPCEGLFVKPDGTVKACGCEDSPTIGSVFSFDPDPKYQTHQCHKDLVDYPYQVTTAGGTVYVDDMEHGGTVARLGKMGFNVGDHGSVTPSFEEFTQRVHEEFGLLLQEHHRPEWARRDCDHNQRAES